MQNLRIDPISQSCKLRELNNELLTLQLRLISAKDFKPSKLPYWKERIKEIEDKIISLEINDKSVFSE